MARRSKPYKLFGSEISPGIRSVRGVSMAELLKFEATGAWRRKYDALTGALIGAEIISTSERRGDKDVLHIASTAAITAREMEINVGHSRTIFLNEDQRQARAANRRAPEDKTERVQCKVIVYPVIGSARGDILRVWPR